MWLYLLSLKKYLCFVSVQCTEGMCASFILGRNEYYMCAGRGHCIDFVLKVKWVV